MSKDEVPQMIKRCDDGVDTCQRIGKLFTKGHSRSEQCCIIFID